MKEAMTVSSKFVGRPRRLEADGAMLTRSSNVAIGSSARSRQVPDEPDREDEGYDLFAGKKFFLNLTQFPPEGLERDLKRLGGSVEGNFSENINCVISDSSEAWPEPSDGLANGTKQEKKVESRPQTPSLTFNGRSSRGAMMVAKANETSKTEESIVTKAKNSNISVWPVGWILQYLSELRLKHGLVNVGPRLRFDGRRRKLEAPFIKFQDAHGWSGPTLREKMKLPVLNVNNKLGRGGSVWTSSPGDLPILYPTAQNAPPKPASNEEDRPRRGRPPMKRLLEDVATSAATSDKSTANARKKGSKPVSKTEEPEEKPAVNGHDTQNGAEASLVAARNSEKPLEEQQKRPRGRPRKRPQFCEYCKVWYTNYMRHVSSDQHEKAVDRDLKAPERKKDRKVFKKAPTVEDFYTKRVAKVPKKFPNMVYLAGADASPAHKALAIEVYNRAKEAVMNPDKPDPVTEVFKEILRNEREREAAVAAAAAREAEAEAEAEAAAKQEEERVDNEPEINIEFVFQAGVPISPRHEEEPWVNEKWVWNLEAHPTNECSLESFFEPEPGKSHHQRSPPILRGTARKTTETTSSPKKSPKKPTSSEAEQFGPASLNSFAEAVESVQRQLKDLDGQSAYSFVGAQSPEVDLVVRDERKKRKRGSNREFEEQLGLAQLISVEEYIGGRDGLKLEKQALDFISRLEAGQSGVKMSVKRSRVH